MKPFFISACLIISTLCYAQKKPAPVSESTQVRNTITSFYKWYNVNWKKITAFKLYKGKNGEEGPPYIIDWKEAEKYFAYLRKNVPYLSEAFIESERTIYKSSEKDFIKYPEDELPSGFDYDHFTNSQEEPKYFLDELLKKDKKWKIEIQPGGKAHVDVHYKEGDLFFCSDLIKEHKKWKIADLACETNLMNEQSPKENN